MLIHKKSKQEKKVFSMHICTGIICKNCMSYNGVHCDYWNKRIFDKNGYCSLFRKKSNTNGA